MKADPWDLAQARLVMAGVRCEGLTLALRADGTPAVRGGTASPDLLALLARHRQAIVTILAREARQQVA